MEEQRKKEQEESDLLVPEAVTEFVKKLFELQSENKIDELNKQYPAEFNKLTENYYRQAPWPSAEAIKNLVEDDPTFMCLYKELTFRHLFEKLQPPLLSWYIESWENYMTLFNGIIDENDPLIFLTDLPNQWVFDLVHEFVYQFQSFCQFRNKVSTKTEEELTLLRSKSDLWSVSEVMGVLQKFITTSKITEILEAESAKKEAPKAPSPVMKMLGYFSIVMTSRAECLFSDYHSCLKHVEVIAANESDGTLGKQAGLYMSVPMCYVTLYFHQGFAQMMMRRYVDAIKSFSSVLLYISRNKQYFNRQSPGDQINKWNDKMLALLAAVVVLCPGQRLDDSVNTILRDKYADKIARMQRGESSAFEDVFSYACPKFILPCAPNYDQPMNYNQDAFQVQVRVFSQEVEQQLQMPTIRSYLKLYRSIGIEKLARFRDTELDTFRNQLLALKHKSYQLQTDRTNAALTEGKRTAASDVHFFISGDMVHIDESREEQRFGDHFISHMHKFEEVITDVGRGR